MNKDLLTGAVLLGVAAIYGFASGAIADSSLADEVGAAGLPRLLTYALVGLGAILIVRAALLSRTTAAPAPVAPVAAPPEDEQEQDARMPRALGFIALGSGYVLLLPFLGYLLSVALLIAAVTLYEGARRRWTVPVAALGGAVLYWAVFVKLLGVNQPVGALWARLLS